VHAPRAERGSLLLWYNFQPDGRPDHRHLHAGCAGGAGEKLALNLWYTPSRTTPLPAPFGA
jgi:hypothetical protein